MALQILPILKTLAPLVANASGMVANMKSTAASADTKEKIAALEREAIEVGELLAATTIQLEALAKQVNAQAELNERLERRTRRASGLAVAALVIASATALYALIWN